MGLTDVTAERMLRVAVQVAMHAPSIHNTQPWQWTVSGRVLRLHADRGKKLRIADPSGRLLTLSCGVALHHVRLAIAAAGLRAEVELLPTVKDPDFLALVRVVGSHETTADERAAYSAISRRHTDRRAFTAEPVDAEAVARMVAAAADEGARLVILHDDQVPALAALAERAGETQRSDPAYRRELEAWTRAVPLAPANAAGVPPRAAVIPDERRVPVRDLALGSREAMAAGEGTDAGAVYGVLLTDDDTPGAWLRAGQGLSAVLLRATSAGLGTDPISDITEIEKTRRRLEALLGGGVAHIAVRIGHPPAGDPPATPRRNLGDVVNL